MKISNELKWTVQGASFTIGLLAIAFAIGLCVFQTTDNKESILTVKPIHATQLPYVADVSKPPTAAQYNQLLHALQDSHLMQSEPVTKSNWLRLWPFWKK